MASRTIWALASFPQTNHASLLDALTRLFGIGSCHVVEHNPCYVRGATAGDKVHKLADLIQCSSFDLKGDVSHGSLIQVFLQ